MRGATNLTKNVIFMNTLEMRKRLNKMLVQGNTTPVVTTENVAGHQISAMKKEERTNGHKSE